ncbi:hypothetical protein TTHERM_00725820 (macronuclear) [Tetrahymena thermophila SB210]|uniref:Uncharacterized protein n=1 Tax=Tetrahymena thermophila (strain SB210) TaxID=312017 RepID=Q24GK8_TETTS|nr:hypothetical protein TTHERM_00725820 [Tetrahymena thermophila SB210]EAS06863.1 hypothetical protein TTHERM_00725820 [Tetrahymena thermophila SB210]|eukprot:XP_001027105.1 hypothetical protein TTHERM_00725820 [Tetrahymena thermophila SB210]
MKAPTYILKRVYLERNQERELRNHEKRLEEIKSSKDQTKIELKKRTLAVQSQQEQAKKNHERATQFKIHEKQREQIARDKVLMKKLVEINNQSSIPAPANRKSQPNLSTLSKSKTPSSASMIGLHSVGRKKEEERINLENLNLANRMVKLPPVISAKKLETEYKKNKELGNKILRFHHLKKKVEKEYDRMEKKDLDGDEIDDGLDPNDEELMNQRVQLYVCFQKIEFINFLPQNIESEKYFMEIKASVRAPRTTTPELYDDFAKSVVNEFFYLRELKKSKLMYIGLYQIKDGNQTFLGDFEIDLTPYYLEGVQKAVKLDLRNFKELYKRPAYMPTDMRRKGGIDFDMKIQSKVKQYLLDQKNAQTELAPEIDKEKQIDWNGVENKI